MKKVILSAVVATFAVAAQAGSIQTAATGSSNISTGALAVSGQTFASLVDGVISSGELVWEGSKATGRASVWILENPSAASKKAYDGSVAAGDYVVTTSGNILYTSGDFIVDPSGTTVRLSTASGKFIEARIDASGRVSGKAKDYLKKTYGEEVAFITTGSGELYTVGEGSVVASVAVGQDSLAVSRVTVSTAGTASKESFYAETPSEASAISSNAPAASSTAATQAVKLNNTKTK